MVSEFAGQVSDEVTPPDTVTAGVDSVGVVLVTVPDSCRTVADVAPAIATVPERDVADRLMISTDERPSAGTWEANATIPATPDVAGTHPPGSRPRSWR